MNRRHFLKKSGYASIAAAGLPLAIRNRQQNSPVIYKNIAVTGKNDQTVYSATLFNSTVEKFTLAPATEKMVKLEISVFAVAGTTIPSSTASCKFEITGAELIDQANRIYKLTVSPPQDITGKEELIKNLPEKFKFLVKPNNYAEILGKKDKLIVTMPYYSTYSSYDSDEDCFLTTACVRHKQLPDDCDELQTLRYLRHQYLAHQAQGQLIISEYEQVGPRLVKAINNCSNHSAIYEYMYQEMILPAVALVKEKHYQEAAQYYQVFVKALAEKYV